VARSWTVRRDPAAPHRSRCWWPFVAYDIRPWGLSARRGEDLQHWRRLPAPRTLEAANRGGGPRLASDEITQEEFERTRRARQGERYAESARLRQAPMLRPRGQVRPRPDDAASQALPAGRWDP